MGLIKKLQDEYHDNSLRGHLEQHISDAEGQARENLAIWRDLLESDSLEEIPKPKLRQAQAMARQIALLSRHLGSLLQKPD